MAILKFSGPPCTQTEGRCDCFRLAEDPEVRYREARFALLIGPQQVEFGQYGFDAGSIPGPGITYASAQSYGRIAQAKPSGSPPTSM